ncbi:hypothetical protein ACFFHH_20190 [Cytobacillus solani]|uniref:hypothetical protein n=1 Tax=Cytobacillus solani TaxID=1637975 RepID=UPI0011511D2C|nr:hypothetical protein [Cytobacillus solani]
MNICRGICNEALKDNDLIKRDFINTLTHYDCITLHPDLIEGIDTFENIKKKHWYYRMELVY